MKKKKKQMFATKMNLKKIIGKNLLNQLDEEKYELNSIFKNLIIIVMKLIVFCWIIIYFSDFLN